MKTILILLSLITNTALGTPKYIGVAGSVLVINEDGKTLYLKRGQKFPNSGTLISFNRNNLNTSKGPLLLEFCHDCKGKSGDSTNISSETITQLDKLGVEWVYNINLESSVESLEDNEQRGFSFKIGECLERLEDKGKQVKIFKTRKSNSPDSEKALLEYFISENDSGVGLNFLNEKEISTQYVKVECTVKSEVPVFKYKLGQCVQQSNAGSKDEDLVNSLVYITGIDLAHGVYLYAVVKSAKFKEDTNSRTNLMFITGRHSSERIEFEQSAAVVDCPEGVGANYR